MKKNRGVTLTDDQARPNAQHSATWTLAARGNTLLKTSGTALRHVAVSLESNSSIAASVLVILYLEHHRTA